MALTGCAWGCSWIPADVYTDRLDQDGDGVDGLTDCDDSDPSLWKPVIYYADVDGDGFGDESAIVESCQTTPPRDTVEVPGDCDDDDDRVHPDAIERCNGIDDDCDASVDDADADLDTSTAEVFLPDGDSDGYPSGDDLEAAVRACVPPSGFATPQGSLDCDDMAPGVNPGAVEVCGDGIDNDCDGATDDSGQQDLAWYVDADDDGWPDDWTLILACGDDGGRRMLETEAPSGTDEPDCAPDDPEVYPGADDAWYDGVDSNCDGADDFDQDLDGVRASEGGGTDCDDTDAAVAPGSPDPWYDGVDSNCDGADDYDQDGDGHRHVDHGGDDCDDTDPAVRPGAIDPFYDGVDSNCDGADDFDADGDGHLHADHGGDDCDDADPDRYPGAADAWYDGIDSDCAGNDDFDQDGDGVLAAAGGGYDCDDTDAGRYPGASDAWYDGVDSDCAGNDDYDQDGDGDPTAAGGGADCDDTDGSRSSLLSEVWYDGHDADCGADDDFDQDADGLRAEAYGGTDCDDTDAAIRPGLVDAWYDGIDSNCDGADDYDQDGDGVPHPSGGGLDCDDLTPTTYPGAPDDWYDGVDADCAGNDDFDQDGDGRTVTTAPSGSRDDCDDTDAGVFPGAVDVVDDGIDQDCSGADTVSCFLDADGDGQGSLSVTSVTGSCAEPGLAWVDGDCDDADRFRFDGAPELCDDIDQDCNGLVEGNVVSADWRNGNRTRLSDGATIDSASIERVDVCGGTWDLQLDWDPADGDLDLVAHPDFARPVLDGTRALVVGSGSGRNALRIEGFDVVHQAPSATLFTLDGDVAARPTLLLDDVLFDAVDVGAIAEVTDSELVINDVVVQDASVDNHALSVEGGTFALTNSVLTRTSRVPAYSDDEHGILYIVDAFAEISNTELSELFGHAARIEDATVYTEYTTWDTNYHVAFVSSTNSVRDPWGGAIIAYRSSILDEGSTFSDNSTAYGSGGAIYASETDLEMVGTTFVHNGHPLPVEVDPDQDEPYDGGAIYASGGEVDLDTVRFEDSNSTSGSAAIEVSSAPLVVLNDVVIDTTSGGDGFSGQAASFWSVDELVVDGLEVKGGTSEGRAMILAGYTPHIDLRNLDFVDAPDACLILDEAEDAVVTESTFERCAGYGIWVDGGASVQLTDNVFDGNTSNAVLSTADALYTENNVYDGNSAGGGGAIYSTGTVHSCGDTFTGNTATATGGAISIYRAELFVGSNLTDDCADTTIFDGNDADQGGAIGLTYYSAATVEDALFAGNEASEGGAIYVEGGLALADDVVFEDNLATLGGAVYAVTEWQEHSYGAARFERNAAENGGAVYLTGNGWDVSTLPPPLFDQTAFVSNTALDGAALYVEPLEGTFEGFFLFGIYEVITLGEALTGELTLDDNAGASVVTRQGTGHWTLTIASAGGQVVDDAGALCTLPEGPSTLSCPAEAPCVCP